MARRADNARIYMYSTPLFGLLVIYQRLFKDSWYLLAHSWVFLYREAYFDNWKSGQSFHFIMLPPAQAESKTVTHTYKPFSGEFFGRVEETSDEERTTHEGGCHCGAVTVSAFLLSTIYTYYTQLCRNCMTKTPWLTLRQFTVTLKWPFPKYTVNSCTCSICTHNGYLLVYPMRQDVKFSGGKIGFFPPFLQFGSA